MQEHPSKSQSVGSLSGGGTTGGGAKKPVRVRSALNFLQRRLDQIDVLTDDDIREGLEFARNIRDNPESSDRDRLRANEYIQSVIALGVGVAQKFAEVERLDNDGVTQRIEVVFTNKLPDRAND